eukprot:gene8170-50827_t
MWPHFPHAPVTPRPALTIRAGVQDPAFGRAGIFRAQGAAPCAALSVEPATK